MLCKYFLLIFQQHLDHIFKKHPSNQTIPTQVTRVVGQYVSGVTGPGNDHTCPTVSFPFLNEVELFASNVLLPSFTLVDCNPGWERE